jgi:hypothetical protein
MPSRDPIRHGINQRLKDSSWRKYAFNALEILDSEPKLSINLENGKTLYRFVEVREPPHSDKDISFNQAVLADMLKHYGDRGLYDIKNADFWGGNQGAAGFIEFFESFIGNFSYWKLLRMRN